MEMRRFVVRWATPVSAILLLWQALLVPTPASSADVHRVAIGDFSSDENVWETITALRDFASALQTELANEPNLIWLERSQLGLTQREIELSMALGRSDLPNAVRRARWSKADWLVTGHFTKKETARELLVEVIDLAHADILAQRRIQLPIAAADSLRAVLAHLPDAANGLRAVLRAADQRERAVDGLPIVAVLFFPDSDVFQREFEAALADPEITGGALRLLRLPRANEALGEAELVLGGFAEDPKETWRSIADVYAWGALVKRATGSVDGKLVTDAHTPEITLTVWDGQRSPSSFVEEGEPVARRAFDAGVALQARRLAARVGEVAHEGRTGKLDDMQREHVSRAVLQSAEQLEETQQHRGSYPGAAEGRRQFFNLTQTLDAACFFDPAHRAAHEKFIRVRWDRSLKDAMRNHFQFRMGRSEAWGRFVERFGLPPKATNERVSDVIYKQMVALMESSPLDREKFGRLSLDRIEALNRENSENRDVPVATGFLESASEVLEYVTLGNREDYGYPKGVPKADAAQWANDLAMEVGRRTVAVAGRKDADYLRGLSIALGSEGRGFFHLRDAQKRVEILEKVWPHVSMESKAGILSSAGTDRTLGSSIKWTFEELGRRGEEEKLFAGVALPTEALAGDSRPQKLPAMPRGSPAAFSEQRRLSERTSRLFRMPSITAPPPEVKPPIEEFDLGAKAMVFKVHDLALLGGRLWLVGEGPEATEVEGANRALSSALLPTYPEASRLFTFDAASGRLERIPATRHLSPVSLLAHEDRLWLALRRDGVVTLDPGSGALQHLGAENGLDVVSAYRFTLAGGRVFVTTNSGVFSWDGETEQWNGWDTEFPKSRVNGFEPESHRLCGLGPWLLLYKGDVGVCDVRSPLWTLIDADTRKSYKEISCVTADARGFWLGGSAGLHFLDPQAGETEDRLRPIETMKFYHSPSTAEVVEAWLKLRAEFQEQRDRQAGGPHPLQPTSRIAGRVSALASDGDFLWVATTIDGSSSGGSYVMLLHKPSLRWVGQFRTRDVGCLAIDDKYVWLGCRVRYGNPGKCLVRLEKQVLYGLPENEWVSDAISEVEVRGAFDRLDFRGRALWHFTGGDYEAAAEVLAQIEPQTSETLFLQGLCFDLNGLKQDEKSQTFFARIITTYPTDPLAEESRKRLSRAAGEPVR